MSNNVGMVFGLMLFGLLVIIMVHYGNTIMASTDIGVNVTGTAYNETYSQEIHTTQISMRGLSIVPYLVGVAALIGAIFLIMPSRR